MDLRLRGGDGLLVLAFGRNASHSLIQDDAEADLERVFCGVMAHAQPCPYLVKSYNVYYGKLNSII